MITLDTEWEGFSFERNRFEEDQYIMRALLEGASNPPQIEQQERAADAYLSRFGREDSAEAQKWVEENAVLPPPDAPITAAREVAVEAKLS